MLKAQSSFLTSLRFNTPWAQQLFPQELIDAKIAEADAAVATSGVAD